MLKQLVIASVIAAALVPATQAQAADHSDAIELPSGGFPGQRPMTNEAVLREVSAAGLFWAKRNVTGCGQGIAVYAVDSFGAIDKSELGGACMVFLRTDLLAAPTRENCAIVFHGVGHALGLNHTPTGVMSAPKPEVPWECRKLAPPSKYVKVRRTKHGVAGRGVG